MKKINDDICNITKNSIQYLKLDDNLKRFIKLTVDLKHSLEAPKDFLNYIFEKDNEWKSKIGEFFKKYEKEVLDEKEFGIDEEEFGIDEEEFGIDEEEFGIDEKEFEFINKNENK